MGTRSDVVVDTPTMESSIHIVANEKKYFLQRDI